MQVERSWVQIPLVFGDFLALTGSFPELGLIGSALGPTERCGPQSLASALILAGFFSALGPVERSGPHSLASAPLHRCVFEGIGLSSDYLTSTVGPMVLNPRPG